MGKIELKINAYRHVNILVSDKMYIRLKEASLKLNESVSTIVRDGIDLALKSKGESFCDR